MKHETKLKLIVPCVIALVGLAFLAPQSPFVRLVVAAGNPDAYEQCILYVEIYQWDNVSEEFDLMANVTYANYVSGYDVDVNPDQDIRFFVKTGINTKFADDGPNAIAKSRAYITITGEVSRTLMTVDNYTGQVSPFGNESLGAVWHHYYWSPAAGKPAAGVTYQVLIEFQAYYDPDDWTP